MTKILTTRMDQKTADCIQEASKKSNMDKASFLRVLITKGLREVIQEDALKQYRNGEISLGKLAELLQITVWDAIDLLQEKHVHVNYSEEQLREDFEALAS